MSGFDGTWKAYVVACAFLLPNSTASQVPAGTGQTRSSSLQESCEQPLSGWFGHAQPFAFKHAYAPGSGIQRFQCGTPPIISLAALEVGPSYRSPASATCGQDTA